jgi:hypothetical protein
VDNYSQDDQSLASDDVSNYDGKPKAAPSRVYIGPEQCRKVFQLPSDTDTGIKQVCGGPEDCHHLGHNSIQEFGPTGMYETVKTSKYVNGLFGTYQSWEDDEAERAKAMAVQAEAIQCLTGAAKYQEQVKAIKEEFTEEGDLYDDGGIPIEMGEGAVHWYKLVALETEDVKLPPTKSAKSENPITYGWKGMEDP